MPSPTPKPAWAREARGRSGSVLDPTGCGVGCATCASARLSMARSGVIDVPATPVFVWDEVR